MSLQLWRVFHPIRVAENRLCNGLHVLIDRLAEMTKEVKGAQDEKWRIDVYSYHHHGTLWHILEGQNVSFQVPNMSLYSSPKLVEGTLIRALLRRMTMSRRWFRCRPSRTFGEFCKARHWSNCWLKRIEVFTARSDCEGGRSRPGTSSITDSLLASIDLTRILSKRKKTINQSQSIPPIEWLTRLQSAWLPIAGLSRLRWKIDKDWWK